MKRYLVLDEPYGFKGGIIGSVDSLDDIPHPNLVGEVIDTTTGEVYEHDGVKWKLNEDIPDGIETEEYPPRYVSGGVPECSGVPYWVDMENGSDDNDGLDINTPLKTLTAALELGNKSSERYKICVIGDQYTEEFRV